MFYAAPCVTATAFLQAASHLAADTAQQRTTPAFSRLQDLATLAHATQVSFHTAVSVWPRLKALIDRFREFEAEHDHSSTFVVQKLAGSAVSHSDFPIDRYTQSKPYCVPAW